MNNKKLAAAAAAGAVSMLASVLVVVNASSEEPLIESGRFVKNPVDLAEPSHGMRLDREIRAPHKPDRIEGVPESSARDISYAGPKCGQEKVREATGAGRIVLTIRGSASRANSYTVPKNVDPDDFNEDFDVSRKSLPIGASREVPSGNFGRLVAYPLYDTYRYDTGGAAEKGTAAVFVGYCYALRTQKA